MSRNWKALILYVVLAIVFTWPLLPNILTHYPSNLGTEGGDPNMYIWVMDMVAQKVMHPSFHPSQMIFYPTGMNFLAGFEAPILLVVGTPVILLTHNPILAYNLNLLLAFILACYACYLLIYYLTKSNPAALITGYSFGFSSYMVVRGIQHIDLLFMFSICLVVLYALKFLEQPSKRNTALLALSIFLTALSAWYYLVAALIFLGLLWLFNLDKFKQAKRQYVITAIAVGFAVLLPALPMILNRNATSFRYVDILINNRGSNPENFFIPHPYIQSWTWRFYGDIASPYESTSYFGLVGLVAAFTLIFLRKKIKISQRGVWIASIIIFILISFGKYLVMFHHQIPMPFLLLKNIIPFDRLRAPNRFFVFAYLAATVIFGYFLAYMDSILAKRWKLIFGVLLLILLLSERVMLPYPLYAVTVPQFYTELGKNTENFAIIDIPIVDPGRSLYNYYQMSHHKPLVAGEYFWTAYSDQTFDFINHNRLLDFAFSNPCSEVLPLKPGSVDKALKNLADNKIRYVVVHNLQIQYDGCSKLLGFFHEFFAGQKPVYSDGEITVFATSAQHDVPVK